MEKLKKVYYQLLNKDFTLSWKDRDGDEIQLTNDEELGEAIGDFIKTNKRDEPFKINVKIDGPSKKQVSYCTTAPFKSEGSLHEDVICDACKNEVKGFRYKCIQCVDYDLCGECEGKGQHVKHNMIRLVKPVPRQSQQLLQNLIQYCCQAFTALDGRGPPPWEAMPPPPQMFADMPYFRPNEFMSGEQPSREDDRMPHRDVNGMPGREGAGMSDRERMRMPGREDMEIPGMPGRMPYRDSMGMSGREGMEIPHMGMPGMRMGDHEPFPPDFPGPPPPHIEEMLRAYMASGGVPPGSVPFVPPEDMLHGGPVPVMIDPLGFGMFLNMEGAPGNDYVQADEDKIKEITDDAEEVADGVTKIDISDKQDSEDDPVKDFVMVTPPGSVEKEPETSDRKTPSRSNSTRSIPTTASARIEPEPEADVRQTRIEPQTHPNPVIAKGLEQLKEMGFSDDNGKLSRLLELKAGNVERVLDILLLGTESLFLGSDTSGSTLGTTNSSGGSNATSTGSYQTGPYQPTTGGSSYHTGSSYSSSSGTTTFNSNFDSLSPPAYSVRDRTYSGGNSGRLSSKSSYSRRRHVSPAYDNYSSRDTPYSPRETSYSSRGSDSRRTYSNRETTENIQTGRGRSSYSRGHSSPVRKNSHETSGRRYKKFK